MKLSFKTVLESLPKIIAWFTPQRIISVMLIIVLSGTASYCAKKSDDWKKQYQTYYDSTRVVLAQYDSVQKVQAALQLVASQQREEIARGRTALATVHNENIRLKNRMNQRRIDSLLALDPTVISREDCLVLRTTVIDLRTLNAGLEAENAILAADTVKSNALAVTLQEGWDNEKRESARLARLLEDAPEPENDKLLGLISLPSRKESLLIGAVVGAIVTIVILK